ncbi:hypothetical protein BsWGS_11916 [Bradybaena similaris]
MQALVFFLFVAVINVGVCRLPRCDQNWQKSQEDICYGYGDTAVSWGNARTACQTWSATLAEVPTIAVSNFLFAIARSKWHDCVWLGGNDIDEEGDWEWSSGSNVDTFTNWYTDEPNNSGSGEDCLGMSRVYNYTWNDGDCNYRCNFICTKLAD